MLSPYGATKLPSAADALEYTDGRVSSALSTVDYPSQVIDKLLANYTLRFPNATEFGDTHNLEIFISWTGPWTQDIYFWMSMHAGKCYRFVGVSDLLGETDIPNRWDKVEATDKEESQGFMFSECVFSFTVRRQLSNDRLARFLVRRWKMKPSGKRFVKSRMCIRGFWILSARLCLQGQQRHLVFLSLQVPMATIYGLSSDSGEVRVACLKGFSFEEVEQALMQRGYPCACSKS